MNPDNCPECGNHKAHADKCRRRCCQELGTQCPGCGDWLNFDNVGEYRNYCQKCVDNLGEPPARCRAFIPRGKYPEMYWECVESEIVDVTTDEG